MWVLVFFLFFVVVISWVLEERLKTIVITDMLIYCYFLLLVLRVFMVLLNGPLNRVLQSTGN